MMLDVKGITVRYGQLTVVRDVSLTVREGEIVSLVGANGAGKSSIINCISGVQKEAAGSIEFLGQDISALDASERVELGLVQIPEGRLLFGSMSVLENLQLGAYTKKARARLKKNLESVFAMFPVLRERKNQMARTLSGGEQQMLTVGRGLMSQPRLLIFDEPSWGLAPKIVAELFATIQRINQEGVTILLVEQHIQQCLRVSDRAYVLENGAIVLEGTGKEVLENSHIKQAYLGI